jgi:heme oxygenase
MITERLKSETRPQHEALETVAFSKKIMDGSLSLAEYKVLLSHNYIVNSLIEEKLQAMHEFKTIEGLDFDQRLKTNKLIADLEVLQLDKKVLDAQKPHYELNDKYEALGAFYVLEGSTLGGAMISRQLVKNENLKEVNGFHYYGVYGELVGPMWKAFQQVLINEAAGNKENEDKMVKKATETFDLMKHLFDAYAKTSVIA